MVQTIHGELLCQRMYGLVMFGIVYYVCYFVSLVLFGHLYIHTKFNENTNSLIIIQKEYFAYIQTGWHFIRYNIHVTYKKHVTNSCGAELFSKIKYLK